MIVGNGLSLDMREAAGDRLLAWNTSRPLHWDVRAPDNNETQFLRMLPRLAAFIEEARILNPSNSDFELFERIANLSSEAVFEYGSAFELLIETRHFLNIAYSNFQMRADAVRLDEWAWKAWTDSYAGALTFAVSFNYDLVLERLFAASGIQVRGFGIDGENHGLRVLKPHGSIDFDVDAQIINMGRITYPLKKWITLNDMPLRRLSASEMMKARTDLNIVLPGQATHARQFQWVEPGFRHFQSFAATWTDCVVVGVSYWECDRPEVDCLLDSFRPGTMIHLVDPNPSSDLRRALQKRGLVLRCSDGPPDI